jgi:mannitol-1-/sugar-/sorbitol-6-phosphatase
VISIECSALLFDLDGVLIDSTPAVERVWSKWAIERGFDPAEVVHRAHGRPSLTTVREYLPNADHEKENLLIMRGEMEDLDGVVALPGAREFLTALPPDRWAIVTSCTRPLAKVRIGAGKFPAAKFIVTSDDIKNPKPNPDPFLKGAALLGFPASDCIVVEDAPAGVRAGKAAGARVIALMSTMDEANLKAAGADWVLPGYSALQLVSTQSDDKLKLQLKIS